MVIPISDSGPEADPATGPVDDAQGAAAGTRERVHPGDVLGDWFDDSSFWGAGQVVNMLTEAYEAKATPETSTDELAAIAVEVVQRYLRDHATAFEPADVAELVDPRAALADWFSAGTSPVDEPYGMLAVAFETSAHEDSTSDELAQIGVDAVQRYLRDCAAETDG